MTAAECGRHPRGCGRRSWHSGRVRMSVRSAVRWLPHLRASRKVWSATDRSSAARLAPSSQRSHLCRSPLTAHRLGQTRSEMAMGLLVEGVWRDDSYDKERHQDGRFNRPTTKFRNWITPDGSAGPSGESGFPAEAGRYHLYVSLACPWAHRTIIFRHLKRLES